MAHQRKQVAQQEKYFTKESSRIDQQLTLVAKQKKKLGQLLSLLNITSYDSGIAPDAMSLVHEKMELVNEQEYLDDQKAVLKHAKIRLSYQEAIVNDQKIQLDIVTRNLRQPPPPNSKHGKIDKINKDIGELKDLMKRLDSLMAVIDYQLDQIEKLVHRLAQSPNFDVSVLVAERKVLEEQKANYTQQKVLVGQQVDQLYDALRYS